MPAVVFIRETLALVDCAVAEKTVALCKRVSNPSSNLAGSFLREELKSHGTAGAHRHLVLPAAAASEHDYAALVFQDVLHCLPVSFDGEFPALDCVIVDTGGILIRIDRFDVLGYRHPEVYRKRQLGGRKKMCVLRHPGITSLE